MTNYGQRITNTVSGSAGYRISARTNLNLFSGYTNQHFFSTLGINNNLFNVGGQLTRSISASTLVGGGYTYTHSTFPGLNNLSFTSNSVVAIYQHTFSPRLSLQASIGPQFTSGSNAAIFPTRTGLSASASLAYLAGRNNYSLNYGHGTTTGAGVLLGAITDYVSFAGQRRFTENWTGGFFGSYGHAQSLSNDPTLYTRTNSFTAGLQATRRLGERFSAYGSYALQYQGVGQLLATTNAFNGTAHVISLGVTYAPRPIHIGRR